MSITTPAELQGLQRIGAIVRETLDALEAAVRPGMTTMELDRIALFEYLLQVPANRIGYSTLSLAQLKILQEVITLLVFIPFAVLYMRQPVKQDFAWAGLCLLGAVYFTFRSSGPA